MTAVSLADTFDAARAAIRDPANIPALAAIVDIRVFTSN
jgi:hypothetical protein